MATLPVTVYRWDDANAPVIANGLTSEIIECLKKCLVEGYGDKQPLGWTIAFEELAANKIAFRNNTDQGGSGSFVVFKGRNQADDDQGVEFQPCLSMTSFDDLFLAGNKQGFRLKTNYGTYNADKWIIIGTAIGFYFIADQLGEYYHVGSLYNCCMYVGDIASSQHNDIGRFIGMSSPIHNNAGYAGDTDNGWGSSLSYLQHSGPNIGIKPFDIAQTNGVQTVKYKITQAKSVAAIDQSSLTNILHPVSLLTEEDEIDNEGNTPFNSYLAPWFRGYLPGFFMAARNFPKNLLWPALIRFQDDNYLLIKSPASNYRSNTLIKLGEWYV